MRTKVTLLILVILAMAFSHTLHADELGGEWIGFDSVSREPKTYPGEEEAPKETLDGISYIWLAMDAEKPRGGWHYFRKKFTLPADIKIKSAKVVITADDAFKLRLNGSLIHQGDETKIAHRAGPNDCADKLFYVDAARWLKPGENLFDVNVYNSHGQRKHAALILKMTVVPRKGKSIRIVSDESWECTNEHLKHKNKKTGEENKLYPTKIIGEYGCEPFGDLVAKHNARPKLILPPTRYLRKEFSLQKEVKKATLKSSALGWYNVHINGKRVGDDYFAPGWTDYRKRVYYNTYDVTDLIQKGDNAIGAIIADGWYAGYVAGGAEREHYGRYPRLRAQLEVEYSDGSKESIVTDGSWMATADGPIVEADLMQGERYDARKEMPGWDKAGFDASKWSKVNVINNIKAKVEPFPTVTVKKFREITPLSVKEPIKGKHIFDLGSNFAGVVRLKVKAPKGTRINLAFGEMLLPDGDILKANLRTARCEDTYICKGAGVEVWQPRFTYHGFQYVRMMGYPGTPDKDAITGIELTSATREVGSFECSDENLNKLYRNVYQTQRANFIDIPTDCPQRDERLGWTGDAQAYIRTACLNMDVQSFFHKWLVDLADAQKKDGNYPVVAPKPNQRFADKDGGPAWADAGVLCPWALYQVYGDKEILKKHYAGMAKFVDLRDTKLVGIRPRNYRDYGDWMNVKANTPGRVIFMAYTANTARTMARIAEVLGKEEDAKKYNKMYERFKDAFNKAYVKHGGKIDGHTQTSYVLALAYDLVDGENRKKAEEYLLERLKARDWHLSTGFVGTKDLMHVLTKIGRSDVAYRLLFNDTYPSWLFSVKNGATTTWERWNSWTHEDGFAHAGMNSFSHYTYGSVYHWMVENIGGIRPEAPGYKKISIKPVMTEKLTWAKVSYDSIQGKVAVNWKRDGEKVSLEVEIPKGATAEIHVPGKEKPETVKGGKHKFNGSWKKGVRG